MADVNPYCNCGLLPSQVHDSVYIFEEDETFFYPENDGKWLVFFNNGSEMDTAWVKAKEAYHSGNLKGVASIKASTRMKNPRASENPYGVIVFHCGPSNDREKMMAIARLIEKYVSLIDKKMSYKSDEMSATGTSKTGQARNNLYVYPTQEARRISNDLSFSRQRIEPAFNPRQVKCANYPSLRPDIDNLTNWRTSEPVHSNRNHLNARVTSSNNQGLYSYASTTSGMTRQTDFQASPDWTRLRL